MDPMPYHSYFVQGLGLARELVLLWRSEDYPRDPQDRFATITLFFKASGPLRAAVLLCKTGYTLQGFMNVRGAFETTELLEYLSSHKELVQDFINGDGKFKAPSLSWVRQELPESQNRSTIYGVLNYMSHANFRGLYHYVYWQPNTTTRQLEVGPMKQPTEKQLPAMLAASLMAYLIRTAAQCLPWNAGGDWSQRFAEYDQGSNELLKSVEEQEQKVEGA